MKFLIVKTSSIGDVIQALPIAEYLKQKFPGCRVDWVVEKAAAELIETNPFVDRALICDTKRWRKNFWKGQWRPFLQEIKREEYDICFDLQGNTKSAFFTWNAKANKKVGYAFTSLPEKVNWLVTNTRYRGETTRKGYLEIVQEHFGDRVPFLSQGFAEKRRLDEIMVCFGSNWPNKQLAVQTIQVFLAKIQEEFDREFLFIYGNAQEKETAELLATNLRGKSLGDLTLLQWQKKMEEVAFVIAMDSAALHLAALVGTPTFSIFGPSTPNAYKPEGEMHGFFQGTCPYDRTFATRCPVLRTCPTGACMKNINSQELFQEFARQSAGFLQTPQRR